MVNQLKSFKNKNLFDVKTKDIKDIHPAELIKDYRLNRDGTDPFIYGNQNLSI